MNHLLKILISLLVAMVTKNDILLVAMEKNLDFNMTNPNMHGFHIQSPCYQHKLAHKLNIIMIFYS